MIKSTIERKRVVTHEIIDVKSGKAYMIYFGNIPDERITQLLVDIAKNGVNPDLVVRASYIPEFLERENLKNNVIE